MSKQELTDNLTFLSTLRLLEQLAAKDLLSAVEVQQTRQELEKRLRPTLLLP